MGTVRIGVSGWSYDGWRGDFYPGDLPRSRELEYAASRLDTVEVNGTFYGLTTPAACREWYRAVPAGFVLAIKGSRFITHIKRLSGVETPLANFFASGILELDDKLGPILWQLPEGTTADASRIDEFMGLLPHDTDAAIRLAEQHDERVERAGYGPGAAHRIRSVLEVRSRALLTPAVAAAARRHGVCLAFSHSKAWAYTEEVTAGFVYLRLHGPEQPYESPYGADRLEQWAARIRTWHAAGQPADAETITGRRPPAREERDVYVYFDNDGGGHAPREAAALREILE